MSTKNFINFHVLISHSPSCLNRDDMNMQKTAVFGGVNRVRISSQSLKRAMRTSDYYAANLGEASTRTRKLDRVIPIFTEALKDQFEPDLIAKTMKLFVRASATDDDASGADEQEDGADAVTGQKKLAVAPWSIEEIRVLCRIVKEVALTADELERAKVKAAKQKGKKKTEQEVIEEELIKKREKAVQDKIELVRAAIGKTKDIALSGRMATSGLMTSVDGSLAVAHAITTHAIEPQDVDWFTAVDDLMEGAGETGAGHLDTQQFSSGVFYRYASLNLRQLQFNLGLIPDMRGTETQESRNAALQVARHVLHMLTTAVPSAKQQTFAAHNVAELAIASFADQPISLANAFEAPVARDRNGGFLKPSVTALAEYWARVNDAYSLDEAARAFSIDRAVKLDDSPAFGSLKELEEWVVGDAQD